MRVDDRTLPGDSVKLPAANESPGDVPANKIGPVRVRWFAPLQSGLVSMAVHLALLIALGLWIVVPKRLPSPLELDCEMERGISTVELDDTLAAPVEFEAPPDTAPVQSNLAAEPFDAPPALASFDPQSLPHTEVGIPVDSPSTTTATTQAHLLSGRDPAQRAVLARLGGGTERSEMAVDQGLDWLARHQDSDGHWSLDAFELTAECQGRCGGQGYHSDTAATALALLPFLGAGETQHRGRYREHVERGLTWLVSQQVKHGNLAGPGIGRMYAHAQGTLALCEALAMTRDSYLREPAQGAVDFLVKAQHRRGGWRYEKGQPGDVSVTGWALMALRSARLAGCTTPQYVWTRSGRFLDSAEADSLGSQYCYMPQHRPSHVMTAEALLCRQYAGWRPTRPAMHKGLNLLLDQHPPQRDETDIYYWYYGTQLMHHAGGEHWRRWNYLMRDILVETQSQTGHERGSWAPAGPFSAPGGRLYMTSLALCTLEVYYRHMPLYQARAVEEEAAADNAP